MTRPCRPTRLAPALGALLLAGLAAPAMASEVEILSARARATEQGWRIEVTLRHDDSGWDHYADAWRVVGPGGAVLAEQELSRPTPGGRPLTRVLSGLVLPDTVTELRIEAHDTESGWAGTDYRLVLPRPQD